MATTTRELELVLIAKNRASSTIARVGGALAGLSRHLGLMGAAGAAAMITMTNEAAQFQQKAALAFTQVEGVANASIKSIEDAAKRIARNIPVELSQVQDSLYDLFSTIDVSNMKEAEAMISEIAKAAAAGQAPMEALGRSTIAWLNALDQPATVENMNRLLNIQSELVRKGAGTFEEMANEVGKAIPAFAKANQTVETFSGTMAFLTRNGLNAAMAATSAARGVELLYGPKAVEGLKKYNVALTDATGNTRAMVDVLRDLVPLFSGKTVEQRVLLFKDMFGQGRIQARRFFDTVLPNFAEYERLLKSMQDAVDNQVMEEMYKTMLDQPLSKIQLLRNNFQTLRIEMGQNFWKEIAHYALPALQNLLDKWHALDDAHKSAIAQIFLLSTGLALVGSVVTGAVAGLTLLIGMLFAFPVATGVAALSIGGVVATLKEIGPSVWRNWERVKDVVKDAVDASVLSVQEGNWRIMTIWRDATREVWKIIRDGAPTPVWYENWVQPLITAYEKTFGRVKDIIVTQGDEVKEEYKNFLEGIAPFLVGLGGLLLGGPVATVIGAGILVTQFSSMIDATERWWQTTGKSDVSKVLEDIGKDLRLWVGEQFNVHLGDLGLGELPVIWAETFTDYWDQQWTVFGASIDSVVGSFQDWVNFQGGRRFIDDQFTNLWRAAIDAIEGLMRVVTGILTSIVVIFGRVAGVGEDRFQDLSTLDETDWRLIINNAMSPLIAAFDLIGGVLRTIGSALSFNDAEVRTGD